MTQQAPNILVVMTDQMSAPLLPLHDAASPIKMPHLSRLASEGVLFDSAYCNSPLDGRSLLPHLRGSGGHDEVIGEYMAEGSNDPLVMIRRGRYKFVYSRKDPALLFDLSSDPGERNNLSQSAEHGALLADFLQEVSERWDLERRARFPRP